MEIENFESDSNRRKRSPAGFFIPNMLNVTKVLRKMGLSKTDIQPITQEDIRQKGIPKQCQDFPQIYIQVKTKHENERRMRLSAMVREQVVKQCERIQWRQQHGSVSMMCGSRDYKMKDNDMLEELVSRENKKLRIEYEQMKKANELQYRIKRKFQDACYRQNELNKTKNLFNKRMSARRETVIQKKHSVLMRLMQKDVYHRNSYLRDIGNEIKQQSMHEQREQYRSVQNKLSDIQSTIMRQISKQDFEQNQLTNQRARQYRNTCIQQKRKQAQQRIRINIMTRLNQQKQTQILKNKVRIQKQKILQNTQGTYLTVERFQSNSQNSMRKTFQQSNQSKSSKIRLKKFLQEKQKKLDNCNITVDRLDNNNNNNSQSTSQLPIFNGVTATSSGVQIAQSQSPSRKYVMRQLKIQRQRKSKYTDQAEWLGLSYKDTQASMNAIHNKLLTAITESQCLTLNKNGKCNLDYFQTVLKRINEQQLKSFIEI